MPAPRGACTCACRYSSGYCNILRLLQCTYLSLVLPSLLLLITHYSPLIINDPSSHCPHTHTLPQEYAVHTECLAPAPTTNCNYFNILSPLWYCTYPFNVSPLSTTHFPICAIHMICLPPRERKGVKIPDSPNVATVHTDPGAARSLAGWNDL